jgi:hypothetical protein
VANNEKKNMAMKNRRQFRVTVRFFDTKVIKNVAEIQKIIADATSLPVPLSLKRAEVRLNNPLSGFILGCKPVASMAARLSMVCKPFPDKAPGKPVFPPESLEYRLKGISLGRHVYIPVFTASIPWALGGIIPTAIAKFRK